MLFRSQLEAHYFSAQVNPSGKPVIVFMKDVAPQLILEQLQKLKNPREIPVIYVRNQEELVQAIRTIQRGDATLDP